MIRSEPAVFFTRVYPNSLLFHRDCVHRDRDPFLLVGGERQGMGEFSVTSRGQ